MPWKEVTMRMEKERFLRLMQEGPINKSELCREFGISRKTGYKLLKRFKEEGMQKAVRERKRQAHHIVNRTPLEIENLFICARKLNPGWGGEKLRQYLMNQGHTNLPSEKTVDRILKRYGLITAEESEKHQPWIRFEHEYPNDLWQIDFKGFFLTLDGVRCYPLTVLDDHSRFSLAINACKDQQAITVKEALIKIFQEYGLPRRMTMDNGSPWGYSGAQLHTTFSAWLIRLGITVNHSRPNHPQTQGKLERMHRTLKLELLSRYCFGDLKEAQRGFDWWREIYNQERPHGALNLEVPAVRYQRSEREYKEILPPIEYDEKLIIRKVQKSGVIYLGGKNYRVGEAFRGQPVALKETEEEHIMDVYFCHQKVVKIDLRYPCKR